MSNDEIRKNDEARMSKLPPHDWRAICHSGFGFLSSFGIRHLDFARVTRRLDPIDQIGVAEIR